jgi:hypothetical protein
LVDIILTPPLPPTHTHTKSNDLDTQTFRNIITGHLWSEREIYLPFFTPLSDSDNLLLSIKKSAGETLDNEDLKDSDYKSYVRRMGIPGSWGGELELLAISKVLQREVWVLHPPNHPDGDGFIRKVRDECGSGGEAGWCECDVSPVVVAYDPTGHYDAVCYERVGGEWGVVENGRKGRKGRKEERREEREREEVLRGITKGMQII